ncbi:hypothetical protein N9L76_07890 [bacterium]|nr:hypothetical protein [bacterium]
MKSTCRECNPYSHGRNKYACAKCKPCPRGRLKNNCADCNPCPHGKRKAHCAACKSARAGQVEIKQEPGIKQEPEPFTIRGYFGIGD